jgi:predicted RNA-binding Zn-ribbon protein involved in translation (DUF1610 family)
VSAQYDKYDLDAAEREGLTPIRCKRRSPYFCDAVLALQEADGQSVLAGRANVLPTKGRVQLRCPSCGYVNDWRPASKPQ